MCFDYLQLMERIAEEDERRELEDQRERSPERTRERASRPGRAGWVLPADPFQACEGSPG